MYLIYEGSWVALFVNNSLLVALCLQISLMFYEGFWVAQFVNSPYLWRRAFKSLLCFATAPELHNLWTTPYLWCRAFKSLSCFMTATELHNLWTSPSCGVVPSNLSHVLRRLPSCTICPRVTQSLTNSPICTQLTVKMFLFRHNFYTNEYKLPACVTNSSPETKTEKKIPVGRITL